MGGREEEDEKGEEEGGVWRACGDVKLVDVEDDEDVDDVDIYIMVKCLFVCHEKSTLPPGSLL